MIDGPIMLVHTPKASCTIELLGNDKVTFDYMTRDREMKFEATESWAARVLGYLTDFYKEQQHDMMRLVTREQQEHAIWGREGATQRVQVSPTVPHCYRCAEEDHIRVMKLAGNIFVDMKKWDKPWMPAQGCFQCGNCGKLTCWTHSDN